MYLEIVLPWNDRKGARYLNSQSKRCRGIALEVLEAHSAEHLGDRADLYWRQSFNDKTS